MEMTRRIEQKLRDGLHPQSFEIVDDSHRHEGHAGWRPGGGTHFRVTIVADAFEGLGRVDRQRLVYGLLEEEFEDGLHALQLSLRAPSELR